MNRRFLSVSLLSGPLTLAFLASSLIASPLQTPTVDGTQASPLLLQTRKLGAMGTELVIEVIDADNTKANKALDAAIAELRRVEDMMTTWRDSPLTRLNANAGKGWQEVPPELCKLVARSLAIAELTEGAFDPTFASVGKLWDFKAIPPILPTQEALQSALEEVGYEKVRLDLKGSRIALPNGCQLGLGGIAKGYGVDRAMTILLQHGIQHGLVNAGGDLKALGTKFGKPWRIAIKHPRDVKAPLAVIPLANTCMVTSGDYERFFELEGVRYHHILDPRTGGPATGCISASVLGPEAAFADALATAMAVLGPKKGLAIIEALPRVEALLVDLEGKVHRSSGLEKAPDSTESKTSTGPESRPKPEHNFARN